MERSLDEIQKSVDIWIQQNGGYWSPLAMLAAVMEELGEVSRELLHITSTKVKKTTRRQGEMRLQYSKVFILKSP